jgi:hypothetical protein
MNCVEFGFDRSRGFGSARGQFLPIAIDRPTRPYNIASTIVQQVITVWRVLQHGRMGPWLTCMLIQDSNYYINPNILTWKW